MNYKVLNSGFTRSDVRNLTEENFAKLGDVINAGGNGYQAEIDQRDAINAMIATLDAESQSRFLAMHAEEVNACIQKTQDRTAELNRQTAEINHQTLQSEINNAQIYSWVFGAIFLLVVLFAIAR